MKLLQTVIAAGALAVAAGPVVAYEAGDILVKAGVITVTPKDDNANTSALVADSMLQITSDTQLGLTGTYVFTPHFGVEVLAATPFTHTVEGDGALDGVDVMEVSHLPPTVSGVFYPLPGDSKLQPYVSLGVNYTFFFDEKDKAGLGSSGLKPSFGLSYGAGVDYTIKDSWLLNAAIWKVDIDTEVRGGAADGLNVEIDPFVFLFACGYKF